MNATKLLTRRDLEREARKYGGWVESDTCSENVRLQIIAPKGSRWSCDGIHALVCQWIKGDHAWRQDAIVDALDRIGHGIEPCDPDSCECGCWGGGDWIGIHGGK